MKMMMKKTNMLLTAALVVLAVAGLTACSGAEDEPGLTKSEPAAAPRTVTLTTTVTRDAEPTRGTLMDDNNQLLKGFQNGDKVAVVYNQLYEGWRKVEGTLSGANGGSATLTAELENPNINFKRIVLIYPASLAKETVPVQYNHLDEENCVDWDKLYNQQDGALGNLASKFDLAVWGGDMTITPVPGSVSVASLPANLTLKNQLAICKINIKDESDTQRKVKKLLIDDGTRQYTVSRSSAESLWYVAMYPIKDKYVYFHAEGSSGNNKLVYYRRATDVTLAKNTYYVSNSLKMNTGKYERGYLLASDGYPYKTESDMNAFKYNGHNVRPAGLIVWCGPFNSQNRDKLDAPDGATGTYCLVMAPRDAYQGDGESSRKMNYYGFVNNLKDSNFDETYLSGTARPDGATAWAMPTATAFMLALDGQGNSLTTFSDTEGTAVLCSKTELNGLMATAMNASSGEELTAGYWTSSKAPATGGGDWKWVYQTVGQFEPIDDTTSGVYQLRPVFWYQPN